MLQISTVHYVVVETSPVIETWRDAPDGSGAAVPDWEVDPTLLVAGAPGALHDALEEIGEPGDNTHKCGCGTPVGWVLDDDDDSPSRGLHWHWATLVTDGRAAWALCEDCTGCVTAPGPDDALVMPAEEPAPTS